MLSGQDVPLLTVPGGTKNHFALALGIASLDDAVAAARGGLVENVDLGSVNDEVFLNTASIGTYAAIVRERDRHEDWPKRLADLVGGLRQVARGHRLTVTVDGRPRRVWAVFAGNGDHGERLSDIGETRDLSDGVLDVRILRADRHLARLRLLGAVLVGRVRRTPVVDGAPTTGIEITVVGEARPLVALDGDAMRLDSPLCWQVRPGALAVLVPKGADQVLESPTSGD